MTEVDCIRGEVYLPELRGKIRGTQNNFDFSSYTCYWALKAQADETTSYVVDPITGTGGDGLINAVSVDLASVEPGVYIAEWQWSDGTNTKKYQYILNVSPRVILP